MKRQRYRPGDVVEFRNKMGTYQARILRPRGTGGAQPDEYQVRILAGPHTNPMINWLVDLPERLITKKLRAGARRLTRRRR